MDITILDPKFYYRSPNKGGLTDWNKMMFEASVIASDIKDEEKIVDLDEIMNKSPLVDASPLSCMNKIGGGEALLLETSSPENSPLKFRFEFLKICLRGSLIRNKS